MTTLEAVEGEDWPVWTDWYQARLDGRPFDPSLEERRVLIPAHLWDDGPATANAAIRQVIEEHQRNQGVGFILDTVHATDPPPKPRTGGGTERLRARLAEDRTAILLSCASILEQVEDYRERVRGDNRMDPEARERLLAFLDRLAGDVEGIAENVPEREEAPSDEQVEEVASWRDRFVSALGGELDGYLGPEALAKAAVPAGLILTCGTLGALLLGGPIGFGAGTYFGQTLVGHMKPGAAADKIRKEMESPDSGPGPEGPPGGG